MYPQLLRPKAGSNLRSMARTSALLASVVFAGLIVNQGWTPGEGGAGLERNVPYAFLVSGLLSTVLAWRSPGIGAIMLTLTGVALGVAASTRHSSEAALAVALLFILPGLLFHALWSSGKAPAIRAAALALIALVLVLGGLEARSQHQAAFGPAHPESPLEPLPLDKVRWIWSGAATSTGFEVRAKVMKDSQRVRLLVSRSPDLEEPVYSRYEAIEGKGDVVALSATGLEPATTYYYAVEVDGEVDAYQRGKVRTFPQGPASFTVAFGSCARTGSNGAVFDAIRRSDPALFLSLGDMHYENIDRNDIGKFRSAYDRVLTSPAQSALYRSVPVAYVWDDHDFGGNNSDASSSSREAARLAYAEDVPHYPFPSGDPGAGIYQAFTIGRVRFILTDTRSERNAEPAADRRGRSMLGSRQLAWFKQELMSSSATYPLVVWLNPDPWISDGSLAGDDWGAFASERQDISDFIATNAIRNLVMLAGDAHMLAIDDGSNSDYSAGGGARFPVFHAGAFDRPGSVKGGPYSEGAFPGAGQFGLLTVEDNGGGGLRVTMRGLDYTGREIISYAFTAG